MGSVERFKGFKHKKSLEGYTGVDFWDLRDPKQAKKRGVEPGLYFTVIPVEPQRVHRRDLVQSLSSYFFDILYKENLIGDNVNQVADNSQSWRFTKIGLTEDDSLLLKAEPFVPDETEDTISYGVKRKPAIRQDDK